MLKLDNKSIEFVNFLSDSNNMDYEIMKEYGDFRKLKYFTTVYNHQWGSEIKKEGNSLFRSQDYPFFVYLELQNVPLFGLFSENKLIEDQTEFGDNNFVVIGTEVSDNVFITTKVNFIKDKSGEYKLDLLPLFKMRNRLLFQAHNQFNKKVSRLYGDYEYNTPNGKAPKDKFLYFIENHESISDLKEIRYNRRVKNH